MHVQENLLRPLIRPADGQTESPHIDNRDPATELVVAQRLAVFGRRPARSIARRIRRSFAKPDCLYPSPA